MKKIIALYDTFSHAQQAATGLAEEVGLDPQGIELEARDAARRYRTLIGEVGGDVPDRLLGDEDETGKLGAAGGALLVVSIPDEMEEPALAVVERFGLVDIQVTQGGRLQSRSSPKEQREGQEIEVRPGVAFRRHHQANYAPKGWDLEMFMPAYRFGYQFAGQSGDDWQRVEPEARRLWEQDRLGEWEQFEDAVRFGWEVAHHGGVEISEELENADLETTKRGEIYQELNED